MLRNMKHELFLLTMKEGFSKQYYTKKIFLKFSVHDFLYFN